MKNQKAVVKRNPSKGGLKKQSLNGTFGMVQSSSKNRLNRSLLSSSNDRLQTPMSKHSRKSSSVAMKHNTSGSRLGTLQSSKPRVSRQRSSSTSAEQGNFQIFSTVDDSPFVVCVPPTATSQVGYSAKKLRSNLMTAEDLACFNADSQHCQLYMFDRVINDCYTNGNTVAKLYSKIVKHRVSEQWPHRSACVLMFGPSDLNKSRKESQLLSCDIDVNLALKTAKDLIARSSESRGGACNGLIYCSVMQIYQDEMTDLMQLPSSSRMMSHHENSANKKKSPYFLESIQ